MGGYDAPPPQVSPRGPPNAGRPPRGSRGKSPAGRGGRYSNAMRGGGGRGGPGGGGGMGGPGGNRTSSSVRDYAHQAPVG